MIKETKAFITEDGQIFLNETEAKEHAESLEFRNKITSMVDKEYYRGMDKDDIIELFIDMFNELKGGK